MKRGSGMRLSTVGSGVRTPEKRRVGRERGAC